MKIQNRSKANNSEEIPTILQKTYLMLLELQVTESHFPNSILSMTLLLHYLIVGFNLAGYNRVKLIMETTYFKAIYTPILFFCVIYFFLLVCVQARLLVAYQSCSRSPTLLKINAVLSITFTKLVFPVLVMVIGQIIAEELVGNETKGKRKSSEVILVGLALLVSTAYTWGIERLRSDIPSRFYLAGISSQISSLQAVCITICQILCCFRDELRGKNGLTFAVLCCTSSFFLLISGYLFAYRRVYWNTIVNGFALSCLGRILIVKTATELLKENFGLSHLIHVVILQLFLGKLAQTVNLKLAKVDLFDFETPIYRLYFGNLIFNDYLNTINKEDFGKEDLELYSYYTGHWYHFLMNKNMNLKSLRDPLSIAKNKSNGMWNQENSSESYLSMQVTIIATKYKQKSQIIKLLSLLQITELKNNFRNSRMLHEKFKSARGQGFFALYESFQLQILWESKLLSLEKGKFNLNQSIKAVSVFDSLSHFENEIYSSTESEDQDYLDIRKVFKNISTYQEITRVTESFCKSQQNIFDLLEDHHKNTAKVCMNWNTETYYQRVKLGKMIKEMLVSSDPADLCTYYYPILIFYYSILMYNVELSDKYVNLYKKKLMSLLINSMYRKGKNSQIGLEIDSVCLQVSLEKDTSGNIMGVSLNANHYLGSSADLSAIGKNISMLLPKRICDHHSKLMQTDSVIEVVNKNRSIFLLDFNGNLKQVYLKLKLVSSITVPVSSYCMITFDITTKGPDMILDSNLNVLAASSSFNRLLRKQNESRTATQLNLPVLSKSLCSSLQVLIKMSTYFEKVRIEENQKKIGQTSEVAVADNLFKLLNTVVEQNNAIGMVYHIGSDSFLTQLTGQTNLHAKFEFNKSIGVEIIKVYISKRNINSSGSNQNQLAAQEVKGKITVNPAVTYFNHNSAVTEGSEDADTNKAIRNRLEMMDMGSENKESLNDKGKILKIGDMERQDSQLHKFEDLILPILNIMEFSISQLGSLARCKSNEKSAGENSIQPSEPNIDLLENRKDEEIVPLEVKKAEELQDIIQLIYQSIERNDYINRSKSIEENSLLPPNPVFVNNQVSPRNRDSSLAIPAENQTLFKKISLPPSAPSKADLEAQSSPNHGKLGKSIKILKPIKETIERSQDGSPNFGKKVKKPQLQTGTIKNSKTTGPSTIFQNKFQERMNQEQDLQNLSKPCVASYDNINRIVSYFAVSIK